MSVSSKKTNQLYLLGNALVGLVVVWSLFVPTTASATAGINQQINFQGRLLNAQGATVPDGLYNLEFKIYQDGDGLSAGDTTGSPAGTLKWHEDYLNANSQGVTVRNGYLSVQLGSITPFGSNIDWNQSTLWLSINVAGTGASCTPFSSCSPDGEMLPMKRLASSPYAMNAGQLGGLTSAQFVQLAQGVQTDASTSTNSIYINKTGSGGNFIDLQASGADVFTLSRSGDVSFGANADHTLSVAASAAGVAGKALTITGGAAGSGSAVIGGNLILQGGAGSGTGSSGSVIVKSNGSNSTTAFQVQNTTGGNLFTVDTANGSLVLGNDGTPSPLTIRGGTASASNTAGANLTFDASNGTGTGGSGDFVFRTAAASGANPITLDNAQSASFGGNTNTTVTWTHVPGAHANQVLVVGIVSARNQAASSVTYEGTALTKLTSQTCGNTDFTPYCEAELWYLVSPATSGTHQISVTVTPGSTVIAGGSATYYNVDTTTPFGAAATAFGTTSGNSQITNTVNTSNSGQRVIDVLASDNTTTTPSGTQLWSSNGNSFAFNNGSSNPSVAGTTAIHWMVNSGDWADIAAPLNPMPNSTPDTLTDRLHITASGNVGIRNANPQYALDVTGTGNFSTAAYAPLFDTAIQTTLGIGTNNANALLIGNTSGATSVTLQAGTGGISLNGATTVSNNFIVTNAGNVAFQRGTDFTTTGTVNNANFGNGTVIRLTGTSAQTITGIAGGFDGRILTLVNAASQAATISNLNAGSSSANQINTGTGNDVSLPANSAMSLVYDGGASVWRIVGSNGGIQLQGSTPGIQQTGNFNISGTGIAGAFDSVASGTLSLGTTNATTINVGNSSATGTIVLRQSGISETITGSATAPTDIIKTSTNSAGAFQVQNSSSNRVLGVDTSANQVLLGQSNALNGSLVFKNSSSSNSITLNSTGVTTSYTLTLPSAAPSTGLCIETSSGSATQLVFASCSNNNTNITEVQEWDANNTNTVAVSPVVVGDEIVLTTQIPTGSVTVSSISGGGVTNWTKAVVSAGNGTVNRVEMWVGTVSSIGSSTITVTYSSSAGAVEIAATEFTAAGVNASTSWGIESTASQLNSTSSATVTFPNMVPVNGAELYVGYAQVQNPPATSGSTTGFSYIITSTQHNVITYNPSTAANTPYQPTASQNSAGQSNTVAVILTAFVTSTAINNATSLQKANFYVQAATSGSVAGVLQAASSGSADILNLRNSSAVNVMTVSNTGATIFKNSTDSSTAFQVQNTAGNSILGVSTSGNSVVLGTASALSGSLVFNNSTNSNTITLNAPSSIAANYTLTLPTNTPTAGLCLGTSPSNATQLIFASCATQVSAASISFASQWSNSGTSVTTLADSPTSTGDLLVLYSHAANNVTVTGVSGGGVTNWTKVTSNTNTTGQGNNEMWRGVVTSTGSASITVTYSSAAGANEIVTDEYTMGSSTGTWAVDTSGTAINSGSQTTVNYPSLTPTNSSELYVGYAWSQNAMSAGSTTGFTYVATNGSKYVAYNTNVSNGSAVQPTASQSVAGNYNSIAALIAAYAGTSVIVNSTATQQANFNVQAAISGTVAGVLQGASSGTADIVQFKNGSGTNIAAVNSSNGLTLGTSNTVGGQLNFAASGNGNVISIAAPTTPGASYTLTLPTTTPAAGQCLATNPNNATQLVFSSCANQVTSVAITYVNGWTNTVTGNSMTLSVSPASIGDLMVLFVAPQKSNTVSSVSGGGVSAWSKITSTISGTGMEMWRGQVTSTGSSTISVTLSGATGNNDIAAYEFTTGSSTGSWVVDTSNTQSNASGTAVTWPSLTPQSTKDLYVGYARAANNMSAGTTSGFTYPAGGFTTDMGAYNTSVSSTIQPTASQTLSGASVTAGALIAAYSSSSVISNSTVTQEANFNIQAATTSSVAGVLQAAQSGTADVMQIMNASGTVVDSFSSTGNLLIQPSTASANALRVQTTLGVNVFSVDTSALRVVIGAGSTGEATPTLLVIDSQTGSSSDPTGVNGAMYYNAVTHTLRCYVDGAWQTCTGSLYTNTSNSSANNNCSNNCAAFSINAPIPANYCQPGRVFKVAANGYFSSQSSASNLQFGVYYGTNSSSASGDTLIGTLSPAATVTSASNNYFQISQTIICFSTSSMQAQGTLSVQTGSASAGMTVLPMGSNANTTASTSSANNIYIFPIWDTASTSNTATLTQLTVNAY